VEAAWPSVMVQLIPTGVDFTTPLPVPDPDTVSVKLTAVMAVDGSVTSAVSLHAYRTSKPSPSVRASAEHQADRIDGDKVTSPFQVGREMRYQRWGKPKRA
jgi:hypothetical protein